MKLVKDQIWGSHEYTSWRQVRVDHERQIVVQVVDKVLEQVRNTVDVQISDPLFVEFRFSNIAGVRPGATLV